MTEKKGSSETDWKRGDAMTDADIDCSDIPELDDNLRENAKVVIPVYKPFGSFTSAFHVSGGRIIMDVTLKLVPCQPYFTQKLACNFLIKQQQLKKSPIS